MWDQDQPARESSLLSPQPSSGGSARPAPVQRKMEQHLGASFGDVRATSTTRAPVFGSGAYDPDSAAGQHTLAHELPHVVQQRSGPVAGTDVGGGVAVSDPTTASSAPPRTPPTAQRADRRSRAA